MRRGRVDRKVLLRRPFMVNIYPCNPTYVTTPKKIQKKFLTHLTLFVDILLTTYFINLPFLFLSYSASDTLRLPNHSYPQGLSMTDQLPAAPRSYSFGTGLLDNVVVTHEQLLERIDEKMLLELGKLAKAGGTLHELAAHMGVSFAEFLMARNMSEDFDSFCQVLETQAAGKHLKTARTGIKNPKMFSAAAYDRVMGALGFTPHVSHVNIGGMAGSDQEAETKSRARVGFDVEDFMGKHRSPHGAESKETFTDKEPIDITPDPIDSTADLIDTPPEDDWERDKDDWEIDENSIDNDEDNDPESIL